MGAEEAEDFIRRFDRNGNGVLEYTEFTAALLPFTQIRAKSTRMPTPKKRRSRMPRRELEVMPFQNRLLENELNEIRRVLALREDFSLPAAFTLFTAKSSISEYAFSKGLEKLGLYPTYNEIHLFFRHFNRKDNGEISFRDFSELLILRRCMYAALLLTRATGSLFSQETLELLRQLFAGLLTYPKSD